MIGPGDDMPIGSDHRHRLDSGSDSASDYVVGYRKPPKSGQFKPGQSGNPRGRKRKQPSVTDRLNKELGRKVIVTEHGKKKTVSKLELMFMTLANLAAKGDLKAMNMIISLLNTQAAETTPDLNTDVMTPEDLAIIEGYLSGMNVGEPYVAPSTKTGADHDDDSGASE